MTLDRAIKKSKRARASQMDTHTTRFTGGSAPCFKHVAEEWNAVSIPSLHIASKKGAGKSTSAVLRMRSRTKRCRYFYCSVQHDRDVFVNLRFSPIRPVSTNSHFPCTTLSFSFSASNYLNPSTSPCNFNLLLKPALPCLFPADMISQKENFARVFYSF